MKPEIKEERLHEKKNQMVASEFRRGGRFALVVQKTKGSRR